MREHAAPEVRAAWRERLRVVIFGTETPAGKAFDVALLATILLSILAVMLETVQQLEAEYGPGLRAAEWGFTALFAVEYALRLISAPRASRYARSFFGVIDLLAVLPTPLSLVLPGAQSMLVIRGLRLLRVFRVFKLAGYLGEANVLMSALRASRRKVGVFVGTVLILVLILGSAMYLVEGAERGFTSIPRAVYWAIVTLTTVGYGDIAPQTVLGQILASLVMIIGYAIIAVPTGIVSAELVHAARPVAARECPACDSPGQERNARFCKDCGAGLERE
jgi:voltage-gated potassium channel